MLKNKDILCISGMDWDSPLPTNRQQIMRRLSVANRIMFVESLGLRSPQLVLPDIRRVIRKFLLAWRTRPVDENVLAVSPLLIPNYSRPSARRFNDWILSNLLPIVYNRTGWGRPILWTYSPTMIGSIGRFDERLVVYHCVDELAATPGFARQAMQDMERRLLEHADIVFTTSRPLYDEKKKYNAHTYYTPNVADFTHFSKAMDSSVALPPELSVMDEPLIGYVGNLGDHKVDTALITRVAEGHPDWNFAIVGPVWTGNQSQDGYLERINSLDNVHLLGLRPYEDLPKYLKAFDVCILPHKLTEYSRYSFPLKFHEFMASGRPIVSTRLPALEEYSSMVILADSTEEFAYGIERAISGDYPSSVEERLTIAKQNTWDKRIEQMSTIIEENL